MYLQHDQVMLEEEKMLLEEEKQLLEERVKELTLQLEKAHLREKVTRVFYVIVYKSIRLLFLAA